MTTQRAYVIAFVVLVGGAFAYSLWRESRPVPTVAQAVAHQVTVQRETVYVDRTRDVIKARVDFRTLRDTLLTHTTDTLTIQTVAAATVLLVKDSLALQAADEVIAAKNAELVLALKPHPVPRLAFEVGGYYEPLNGTLSGSAGASFRVIGGLALAARIDQRAAIGERPVIRLGVRLTL